MTRTQAQPPAPQAQHPTQQPHTQLESHQPPSPARRKWPWSLCASWLVHTAALNHKGGNPGWPGLALWEWPGLWGLQPLLLATICPLGRGVQFPSSSFGGEPGRSKQTLPGTSFAWPPRALHTHPPRRNSRVWEAAAAPRAPERAPLTGLGGPDSEGLLDLPRGSLSADSKALGPAGGGSQ